MILLAGANGQVGHELRRTLAPLGAVVAHDRSTLDLADPGALRRVIRALKPTVIVNAAAYTQVDRAESEPDVALLVNGVAPGVMAEEARALGALLVHYSTDYVFDGTATTPYTEDAAPAPTTAYGRAKHAGDLAVLAGGAAAYIFRVGWVYGGRGPNFLRTVQRLAAERDELRIVADQHGGPTWCCAIAEATAAAISRLLAAGADREQRFPHGVYHMAPPDVATWYEFASAIVNATLPEGNRPVVVPITTAEYPTPARRPAWSALDSTRLHAVFGLALRPWREQLADCLVRNEVVE